MSSSIDEAPKCPVCRSIYVRPRLYSSCGHSVCETCMCGMDNYTDRYSVHDLPVYKCPVCRGECLEPWWNRPFNQTLDSICQQYPEYETRVADVDVVKSEQEEFDRDVDLAKMASFERKRIAKQLYRDILPLLVTAAKKGSSYVSITEKRTIDSISRVMDIFSKYLFKHKIYRIVSTPNEVTISILKQQAYTPSEYINPELSEELEEEIEESGAPRLSRISRAVDRLTYATRLHNYRLPSLPSTHDE